MDKIRDCVAADVDMTQFYNLRSCDYVIGRFQKALDEKLNPPPSPPKPKSKRSSRGAPAASIGTPARARDDDEEAATDMLARLQRCLADTECDIDGDDRHTRLTREKLATKLMSELLTSSGKVESLLAGSWAGTWSDRDSLLSVVVPFGDSQFGMWKNRWKENHGVEPTVDDVKAWLQGKIEAQGYVDEATRETWSEAIDKVEAVTTKLAKPTATNPMVGRGGECEGCQWVLRTQESRNSGNSGRVTVSEGEVLHPCTCATRPDPEQLNLDQGESVIRTFDMMMDKLRELAMEYLRALKRDDKLEEHLRARAAFVVAQTRKRMSATSRRGHELNPNQAVEMGRASCAAIRRAGLGPERYLLAERNLDPFSRRCRVVARKLKSTRRIRDYTRFVDETDYTQLKEKTD